MPLTALLVGWVSKGISQQALQHIKETQVIGGTPAKVFAEKAEVGMERQRQVIESRKPKAIKGLF